MSPGAKLPLDAYVLAVPVAYACVAFGALIFNTIKNDPDQSTMAMYAGDHDDELMHKSQAYHYNPAKRFFDARVSGRQTWGFFENDFSKQYADKQ